MRFYLIGFMGSGKSHWASKWSERFDFEFHDLDKTIESLEKKSVGELFETKGEEWFRQKESEVLRDMNRFDNCIISCGGGTPCYLNNMEWMNQNGFSIYLNAKPEFIFENIIEEKNSRPLIKDIAEGDLHDFIKKKLEERKPFYEKAKLKLDVTGLSDKTFGNILNSLNK